MTQVIDTYELSPMQAGMLFHAVSGEDRGIDLEQVVATLREPLEEAHFVRAWQRVVERHPVLRSRFSWEGVVDPAQEVLDHVQIPVERFDWRALAEAERRERFQTLLGDDRTRGFDLDDAPLMRLVFVRAAEREHWVLWTFHHALLDGRSWGLLLREIFAFYDAFSRGEYAERPRPRPYLFRKGDILVPDAVFWGRQASSPAKPWAAYAKNPVKATLMRDLTPQLRKYVVEAQPDYMVPDDFVTLERLPLTPNGKWTEKP